MLHSVLSLKSPPSERAVQMCYISWKFSMLSTLNTTILVLAECIMRRYYTPTHVCRYCLDFDSSMQFSELPTSAEMIFNLLRKHSLNSERNFIGRCGWKFEKVAVTLFDCWLTDSCDTQILTVSVHRLSIYPQVQ